LPKSVCEELNVTAANELQTIACKALTQAAEKLAGIRAETTAELQRKARVSDLIQESANT
jgi:hypothetical protein